MKYLYPNDFLNLMGETMITRNTFRNYFPEEFKNLNVTISIGENGKKVEKTFDFCTEYLDGDTEKFFMSDKGRPALQAKVAEELGGQITEKILERVIVHNTRRADRLFIKKSLEEYLLLLGEDDQYIKRDLSEAYEINSASFFMVLLMYTLFQSSYSSCAQTQVGEYLTHKKPTVVHMKPGSERSFYDIWRKPLFLERDSEKTLENVYVLPSYTEGNRTYEDNDALDRYIDRMINTRTQKRLSLILGDPGTGKSTLFSHLLNRTDIVTVLENSMSTKFLYHSDSGMRPIRLYCFKDMNKHIEWKDAGTESLLQQILSKGIGLQEADQLQNTILLLDGLDEFAATNEQRKNLIPAMAEAWGPHCSIFVTCRKHYLPETEGLGDKVSCISLDIFNKQKMSDFICGYKGWDKICIENLPEEHDGNLTWYLNTLLDGKDREESLQRHDVYGIPIILYMVLAMEEEIHLGEDTSLGAIYDKIFNEKGGIYKRQLDFKTYDSRSKTEDIAFDIKEEKQEAFCRYLGWISRMIARYMFEENCIQKAGIEHIEAYVHDRYSEEQKRQSDWDEDCFKNKENKPISFRDILSKGMFMYVDAPEKTPDEEVKDRSKEEQTLRYCHKSMYEYFLADLLYRTFEEFYTVPKDGDKAREQQKIFHSKLADILKKQLLSAEVGTFWVQKIENSWDYIVFENVFIDMLNTGMTFYNQNPNRQKRKMEEAQVFENLMYLVQLFRQERGMYDPSDKNQRFRPLFGEDNSAVRESFPDYLGLRHYRRPTGKGTTFVINNQEIDAGNDRFDLCGANLAGMDLSHKDMSYYRLHVIDARETSFRHARLDFCNLSDANLTNAAFTGATLWQTEPSANELFDDPKWGIPWTQFEGYIAEPYNLSADSLYSKEGRFLGTYPFGKYPMQSREHPENKDPILWDILEIRDNRMLLVSQKILDVVPYNNDFIDTNWKECTLNQWLKHEFLDKAQFTDREKERICTRLSEPHSNINQEYQTDQGEASVDEFFLLSGQELVRYCASPNSTKAYRLDLTKSEGQITSYSEGAEGSRRGYGWWWLRSVGVSGSYAMHVYYDGDVSTGGDRVYSGRVGVRPALYLRIENLKS